MMYGRLDVSITVGMDCTRGTDSHSIYNWAENMRYWSTDFDVPFPGSEGAKVHTGLVWPPPASMGLLLCRQSAVMLSLARDHHRCKRMHVRLTQTIDLSGPYSRRCQLLLPQMPGL